MKTSSGEGEVRGASANRHDVRVGWLWIAAMALCLAACGGAMGPAAPCEGVSCSGRGACFEEGGLARCDCDPGFVAEDTACLPEGEGGDGDVDADSEADGDSGVDGDGDADSASEADVELPDGGGAGERCARAHPETVRVGDDFELGWAVAEARCGQEIVLADGEYGEGVDVDITCPADDPLVIRSGRPLGAALTARVTLAGARVCAMGLVFEGPDAILRVGGRDHGVFGNSFRDWRGVAIGLTTGEGAEIAYNELSDPHPWLAEETDEPSDYPLRIGVRTIHDGVEDFHFRAWVHHNHFHDFPPKPNPDDYHSGQADALELCETATPGLSDGEHPSGWLIEHNLIERHLTGHGVIDLKCGGATVRFNTLVESPGGRIDCRNGPSNELVANWIEDAGGMTVRSAFHRLVGNHLERTAMGIALMAGTVDWDFSRNRTPEGDAALQRAFEVHLAGNVSDALTIGRTYSDAYDMPAIRTLVEAHEGPIRRDLEEGTTVRDATSLTAPVAVRLLPEDVGPEALPWR